MKTSLKIVALLAFFSVSAHADTLLLKDGRKVQGSLQSADGRQIRMLVGDKVETYSLLDATSLSFGDGAAAATPAVAAQAAQATTAPAAGLIPAGTMITVLTIDSIDSRTAKEGQMFRASLDEPIVVNGQTIAAKNADAFLKLEAVKQSGKLTGAAELTVAVDSVVINGNRVSVSTGAVTSASEGKGKQSATRIGIGTGAGAIIGGILGGGKGAAIGAGTGAAAGTALQMATKGPRVVIQSESRLSFTVDSASN